MTERLVLDTNVLISYAIRREGRVGQLVGFLFKHHQVLYTGATLRELTTKLAADKFKRYITDSERAAFISAYLRTGTLVTPNEPIRVCRDSKDDQFLEAAVGGNADCLVTGDADLLVLNPFRGIRIMTPQMIRVEFGVPDDEPDP